MFVEKLEKELRNLISVHQVGETVFVETSDATNQKIGQQLPRYYGVAAQLEVGSPSDNTPTRISLTKTKFSKAYLFNHLLLSLLFYHLFIYFILT